MRTLIVIVISLLPALVEAEVDKQLSERQHLLGLCTSLSLQTGMLDEGRRLATDASEVYGLAKEQLDVIELANQFGHGMGFAVGYLQAFARITEDPKNVKALALDLFHEYGCQEAL
jgi:hypothetical protein